MTLLVTAADLSAHRRDEFLQAARIAVEGDRVELELDLTPGMAIADDIIAAIDRDRDGTFSTDETAAYAAAIIKTQALMIDRRAIAISQSSSTFPEPEAIRAGSGVIHINATVPILSTGGEHQLAFRNGFEPAVSVYLANALVPENDDVMVTAQHRTEDQSELKIDYSLPAEPNAAGGWWAAGITGVFVAGLARWRQHHHLANGADY